MTLPVVPGSSLSFSQINTELGLSSTATISLNDAAVRTLAGVGASPATIAITNLSGKSNEYAFTISSNQTNANLRTLALNAGWPGTARVAATIGSGIQISSTSTGTPALTVNGSFPGGVSLVNTGVIVGKGGAGGNGGDNPSAGGSGAGGGTALAVSVALTLTNGSGTISGGGGGGGGGAGAGDPCFNLGGGGGGGGNGFGAGGTQGSPQVVGAGGSAGGQLSGGAGGSAGAPSGGSGGSNAASGGTGSGGAGPGGSGGSGGAAITGNSNITYVSTGTRYGSIS